LSKTKLSVFTDFVIRTQYLNKSIIGSYGYGKPTDSFKKYFIQTYDNFENYLLKNSVTSIYKRVYNSFPNILWYQYADNNPELSDLTETELQEQYISYGQFELLIINFIQVINYNVNKIIRSLVTVNSENQNSTGFLYNGNNYNIVNGEIQVYLVTVYSVISNSLNKNIIFGTIDYFDEVSQIQVNCKLAFKIIGYDIYTNVLVALYDPNLDYNIQFNSDLNIKTIPRINIDGLSNPLKNSSVYAMGNIGEIDTNDVISGKLMNNRYRGNYHNTFFLGFPESYLINFNIEDGFFGAPVFIENDYYRANLSFDKFIVSETRVKGTRVRDDCIGMIIGSIGDNLQYTVALSGFYLSAVVNNAISRWYNYGPLYDLKNINLLNFFIKDSYTKKWLGIEATYYKNNSIIDSDAFSNFNLMCGLIVSNFIVGFNTLTEEFIVDTLELDKYNVVKINTPLLNTKMYSRFVYNNNVPIIIKFINAFENVESKFGNFLLGLKTNQCYGYESITYDLSQINSQLNDPKYINRVKHSYPQIRFTYIYYDGNTWKEDTEIVGDNTPEWYNEYITDTGYLLYQHKFEFPLSLISYTTPYINSI